MNYIKKILHVSAFIVIIAGLMFFEFGSRMFSGVLNYQVQSNQLENIAGMDELVKLQNVYRSIAKATMPAVVMISVESEQTVDNPYSEFFNDPFFKGFFGNDNMGPRQYKQKIQILGSGFIVTPDGYIFSNYNVVEKRDKSRGHFSRQQEVQSKSSWSRRGYGCGPFKD